MKAPSRFLLSLILSAIFELAFFKLSILSLQKPKLEVKRVIRISLIRKKTPKISVNVTEERGKSKKEFKKQISRKTNLKSRNPVRRINGGKKKKEENKGGGLKPLEGNLPKSYVESVKAAIEENLFYPFEAVEGGIEGTVMVRFTLNRSGKAVECKPLFGYPILCKATCVAIRKAKFPPIPKSLKNEELHFQLQLEYNLEKPKF